MQRVLEQDTSELTEYGRENDLALSAARCNEVFQSSSEVPEDVKVSICELHIGTLQKLWLPKEYMQRQTDAYKQYEEHIAHCRNKEAQNVISDLEDFLLHDPEALRIRRLATKGLHDRINPAYRDEFDLLTGYRDGVEEQVVIVESQQTKPVQIVRGIGSAAARGVTNLRRVFAK